VRGARFWILGILQIDFNAGVFAVTIIAHGRLLLRWNVLWSFNSSSFARCASSERWY
jgi:hypothetical protein